MDLIDVLLAKQLTPGQIIKLLAADYLATQTYDVGDYVAYQGKIYKCTIAITVPEAWTAAHWSEVIVTNELKNKADLINGKVPSSQLPSYVDDVLEVNSYADLPATGETGKIYITIDTNRTYRWTGTTYALVGGEPYTVTIL